MMDVAAKPQPTDSGPFGLVPLLEVCCCTRTEPKEAIPTLLLGDDSMRAPSLVQLCCFLSSSEVRVNSGIESIPEIAGLAGVTMQTDGGAENNVQTLKWAIFDAQRRTALTRNVAGARVCGVGGSSQLATWVIALPSSCPALCCITWGMSCIHRQCDFTYKFVFDDDWRRA